MGQTAFKRLQNQLENLLRSYVSLLSENRELKQQYLQLQRDNEQLMSRNALAAEKNRQALHKITVLEQRL